MLLTLDDVAQQLQCSTKHVRRDIDAGILKTVRLGKSGKSDRIDPDDLVQYINYKRSYRQKCRSTNVVEFIGSRSLTADKELESRLAKGRRRAKPKKSNQSSGLTSTRAKSGEKPNG